ncbi:hypothetical protein AWH49_06870 [Domibacillus aminovorans]|uniref:Uncharacterized protein n=1 Tax=Domibacillus aminovorans TaxID=29332 RepID=A0A177LCS3_9BACI|nr:hypothetical protein AWH49_06870 [Domibacillus aminovorans]
MNKKSLGKMVIRQRIFNFYLGDKTILTFFRKQFLEDRIKPILFLQVILVTCAIIVYLQTYNRIDYFYSGILNIIAGVIFFIKWY